MAYRQLDGALFRNLLDYGIRNLSNHCEEVNALNVFPVPDGDTGTNMVTTLRNGYGAIRVESTLLYDIARQFSGAVVYGARGNSGVIVSQFFKGICEYICKSEGREQLYCAQLTEALRLGVRFAYDSVSHPTEGTILTVMREATEYIEKSNIGSDADISDLFRLFINRARISLENTPNLLPTLKQAGVVDSGGIGIIYFFEGMQKYINGESLEASANAPTSEVVDYSNFSRDSKFEFGYCTEFLLQLTNNANQYDEELFKETVEKLGDSIVYSFDNDKVKLHIHTQKPAEVLAFAHRYGEFLMLKIENMSVQHTALKSAEGKVVDSHKRPDGAYAVVAVSHSESLTRLFEDMGADVVISLGKSDTPCVQDFIDAYKAANNEKILVFPNNINYVLTANQARELYGEGEVVVLKSRTVADCYSALAFSDFLCEDFDEVVGNASEVIENIYAVRITTAARDAVYGDVELEEGDVIAISGITLLGVGDDACSVACDVISRVMDEDERDCITVFHSSDLSCDVMNSIKDFVSANYVYTEINFVSADDGGEELLISFE